VDAHDTLTDLRLPMGRPSRTETRTPQQLREHYDVERRLADRLRRYQALGKQPIPDSVIWVFVVWDFVMGIGLVWLYAAIRPRFGAGVKTAVIAGLALWFFIGLMSAIGEAPMGLFPQRLYTMGAVVALIKIPLASVVGAYVYTEA